MFLNFIPESCTVKMVKICSQIVLSAGPHSISQLASSAHDRDLPKTKEYERSAMRERE